jgi:hypothetical protein
MANESTKGIHFERRHNELRAISVIVRCFLIKSKSPSYHSPLRQLELGEFFSQRPLGNRYGDEIRELKHEGSLSFEIKRRKNHGSAILINHRISRVVLSPSLP